MVGSYSPRLVGKAFKAMDSALRGTNFYINQKAIKLRYIIATEVLVDLERAIRVETIFNLTDYTKTNSRERDPTQVEAFELLEKLIGFEWNKSGSFTIRGAIDAINEDVNINRTRTRVEVILTGKLEELEKGIITWDNMKRFFYNYGVKQALFILLPNYAPDFYKRLDKLFKKTSEEGRPYISKAIEDSNKVLRESIEYAIEQAFDNEGKWF